MASKLKWNHEPQASGFTAKFWTFWRHCYNWWAYRPWKIFVDLSFTIILTVFDVHFRWNYSENRPRKKEKNKLRHHQVTSIVCCLIDHSSRPALSAQEIIIISTITFYHRHHISVLSLYRSSHSIVCRWYYVFWSCEVLCGTQPSILQHMFRGSSLLYSRRRHFGGESGDSFCKCSAVFS